MAKRDKEPIPFEKAMEQVEAITQRIESGEIGLEQSITEFEKGMDLIARCREMLQNAEQRVEEVTRRVREGAEQPADRTAD